MRSPVAALLLVAALALPAWGRRIGPEPAAGEAITPLWGALEGGEIGVRHTALLARELRLSDGESTYYLDRGYVFRLYTDTPTREDVTVGFAFVGEGRQEIRFQDPRDGRRFANHMVLRGGWEADELRDIAEGEPFTVPVSRGLVLSADPAVGELLSTLPQLGGGAQIEAMEGGTIAAGDTRERLEDGIRGAERMLRRRLLALREAGFGPRRLLARELLLGERGLASAPRSPLLADFRAAERPRGEARLAPGFRGRWLTHLRDDSGEADSRLRSRLFISGAPTEEAPDRPGLLLVSGQRFPPSDPYDRLSPPLPAVRPEPVHARLGAKAVARWSRHSVDIAVDSYLEIAARGGPISTLVLRVPREESRAGSWAITAVDGPDGFPLDFVRLDEERAPGDRADCAELLIFLGEPLAEDHSARIRVAWRDTWALSGMSGWGPGLRRAPGSSTGLHRVIPQLGPYDGDTPWSYNISVRLPEEARQSAAITGRLIRNETDGDWRIMESSGGPTAWAGFAVGEWESRDEPPAYGMPGVRVNLLRRDRYYLERFAPLLRQELAFFEALLPPLGRSDLELFQDADRGFDPRHYYTRAMPDERVSPGDFVTGRAPDGLLAMSKLHLGEGGSEARLREAFPELESGELAAQLARQWWGGKVRVLHARDHWLVDTLSEAYGLFYLRGAFEPEVLLTRLETTRDIWRSDGAPPGSMSLTEAPAGTWSAPAMLNYGPYVIAWTLRWKLGEARLLDALGAFQREYAGAAVSTEHLLVFLKQYTGVDLDDFFDFWIYGGWLPELEVRYAVEPAEGSPRLLLQIRSGVPFGAVEVPVGVVDGWGRALALTVLVEDGEAELAIDLDGLGGDVGDIELRLDPELSLLTRSRTVRRVPPGLMGSRESRGGIPAD